MAEGCIGRYVTRPDLYVVPATLVREAYDAFILGSLRHSKAVVEFSWELWPQMKVLNRTLLGTCITVINIWQGDRHLFGYELGKFTAKGDPSINHDLTMLIQLLKDKEMSTLPPRRNDYVEPSAATPSDEELRRVVPSRINNRLRNNLGKRGRGPVPVKMRLGARDAPRHG